MKKVLKTLEGVPAFTPNGQGKLTILDKRVKRGQGEENILFCSKLSDQKLAHNITCYVLLD